MSAISQSERIIEIKTPLGTDVLLLRSFTGTEAVSQLFRFHLDMLSENFSVDFDSIVGKSATVEIRGESGPSRYINGFISRFAQLPVESHLARYEAELVPWFWFLTRAADCRIFQEKNVQEIFDQIFSDFGFSDYRFALQQEHPARTYCVQYRETAANFISRLMEEEGIFYYFEHEDGKHTMVIADDKGVHETCPESEARYEHTLGPGSYHEDTLVHEWRYEQELRTGKYALNDFNFETPSTSLLSPITSVISQGGNQKYEIYDYPGEYLKKARGEKLARLRMEEEETPHTVVAAAGNARTFTPGFKFSLTDHDRSDQNREYILTAVTHSAHAGGFIAGAEDDAGSYANRFTCIPSDVTFRPARVTPKPLVQGCQTAMVVGPKGEEIYVDKYGRVKVQFHWDREGKRDEKSSCWIRVSQLWAGKNWGAMHIPRITQEVIVDFLEGDPDRPIITGRVYNAESMPPYSLPSNMTQSGVKSRSSKKGTGDNYNEIRLEDKKGNEMITVHAEKDMETEVENDDRQHIMNNRTINVDGKHTETIVKDTTITIKRGNHSRTVEMGDKSTTLKMGNDTFTLDMGNQDTRLKMGNQNVKFDLGKQTTEAMQSIEMKVGQSSIKIDQMGVTIKGMMIKVQGQILVEVKSGAITKVEGSAMLVEKGGIVMIN